jgi:hypothetical protein
VILGGFAALIISVRDLLAVACTLSVTCSVTLKLPEAAGVPLSIPVEFIVSPAGSEVADQI